MSGSRYEKGGAPAFGVGWADSAGDGCPLWRHRVVWSGDGTDLLTEVKHEGCRVL
jgi:hypothetical protein